MQKVDLFVPCACLSVYQPCKCLCILAVLCMCVRCISASVYIFASVGVGTYQLCDCTSWGYVKLSEHVWAFKSVYLCIFDCAS